VTRQRIGFAFGDWDGPTEVGNGHMSGLDYLDEPAAGARVADYRPAAVKQAGIADYVPKKAAK
jgi:hypothetical protein